MHVVLDDAFRWLRDAPDSGFDAVIVDLPDPDTPALGRLYSTEFYGLAAAALNPGGLLVVQSGSPVLDAGRVLATMSTVARPGLAVTPYHVLCRVSGTGVPSSPGADPSRRPCAFAATSPNCASSTADRSPRPRCSRATVPAANSSRPPSTARCIVDDMRKGYER